MVSLYREGNSSFRVNFLNLAVDDLCIKAR